MGSFQDIPNLSEGLVDNLLLIHHIIELQIEEP